MTMLNRLQILREHPLFNHLSDQQLEQLVQIGKEITLKPNEFLIHEGEAATNFFIVIEGTLDVIKSNINHQKSYSIAHLAKGDTIGEMALIDQGSRSASVKADTTVLLLEILIKDLRNLAEHDSSFNAILLQIAKNLSVRLRVSNEANILSLEKQLEDYKRRVSTGSFMMNIIVALCLFTFFTNGASYFTSIVSTSTEITIPITFLCLVFTGLIIQSSYLPLSKFGLTTKNWQKSIFESVAFTSVLMLIMLITKWLILRKFPGFFGTLLFEPFSLIRTSSPLFSKNTIWVISLISYWLLVAPLQELIARGSLQGPLEDFFTGEHNTLKAILISNLMFATAHLFLSLKMSLIVFFTGLYFGWLYSRHRTLVGVIIAHALIGTWGFWILGGKILS